MVMRLELVSLCRMLLEVGVVDEKREDSLVGLIM